MRQTLSHCMKTLVLAFLWVAPAAFAEVTLPSVFGDHMVLQRDAEVRIWGKAEPGESLAVQLERTDKEVPVHAVLAVADENGDWRVELPKRPAEGTWRLQIEGSKEKTKRVINDIVFGEVWVASGQSNMAWKVSQSANAKQEIANSDNEQIRMWTAKRTVKTEPAFDVKGAWQIASPKTTGNFSAVAYSFARKLQAELGVPVGVLHASWGGTPVEAWTRRGRLEQIDWAGPILQRYDAALKGFDKLKAEHDAAKKRWNALRNGPDNTGFDAGYADSGFDDSQWQTMALPQTWDQAGINKDGVMWYRRSVDVPESWVGQALTLSLGPIDDGDTTYINGTKVGQTVPYNTSSWRKTRNYNVPAKLVGPGTLTLAVRVVDLTGSGGVWGKPEQMTLARADGQGDAIPLAGDWKYRFTHEINARNRPVPPPAAPFGPGHPHAPAGLYNGMIAPITPYTIRGAIWYQGESNASRAQQYRQLFPGMIHDWRQQWGQGAFPFLFVQLANYRKATDQVVDTDWAHLRDAQLHTLRTVKNTGMAVTIDIGDANDIHPRNKQDVGQRLARWALADTYGKEVVRGGPFWDHQAALEVRANRLGLTFESYGGELATSGVPVEPKGFTIAGKDRVFHVASVDIDSQRNMIWVWSDQVKEPVAVRYAWEDNPTEANLVNEEGLPASPFRTDDWTGPTDGRR